MFEKSKTLVRISLNIISLNIFVIGQVKSWKEISYTKGIPRKMTYIQLIVNSYSIFFYKIIIIILLTLVLILLLNIFITYFMGKAKNHTFSFARR